MRLKKCPGHACQKPGRSGSHLSHSVPSTRHSLPNHRPRLPEDHLGYLPSDPTSLSPFQQTQFSLVPPPPSLCPSSQIQQTPPAQPQATPTRGPGGPVTWGHYVLFWFPGVDTPCSSCPEDQVFYPPQTPPLLSSFQQTHSSVVPPTPHPCVPVPNFNIHTLTKHRP